MTTAVPKEPSGTPPPPVSSAQPQAPNLALQLRRFLLVGCINTALDLGVLNLLIILTHVGQRGPWFTLFKAGSFSVALVNSYFMNHGWTFRHHGKSRSVMQAGHFVIVSLIGALLNISSSSYIATFIPPIAGAEKFWPTIAALVGAACGLGCNFLGYRHVVFSPRPPQPDNVA